MAINFPDSPTTNQVFTVGSRSWIYDGAVWKTYGVSSSFTPSTTAPTSPAVGDQWLDTNSGRLYMWYDSYWMELTGAPAFSDASTLTGTTLASNVQYSSLPTGRKNRIINGAFDVWQRGGGNFTTSATYTADQWYIENAGSTHTLSRQAFTVGNPIAGYEPKYYLRDVVASSAGVGNYAVLVQKIESSRTFAGQQCTLSFWAKADANKNIAVEFEQTFGTGGSPSTRTTGNGSQLVALTTSWTRKTLTVTLPSITGKTLGTTHDGNVNVNIWLDAGSNFNSRTASLGQQSGTFEFWGFQLEPGPVATPFEVMSYGEQLALCQRYYQRHSDWKMTMSYLGGFATSYTGFFAFPVTMRATPNIYYTRSTHRDGNANFYTGASTGTSLAVTTNISNASGFVAQYGGNYIFMDDAYIEAEAEL